MHFISDGIINILIYICPQIVKIRTSKVGDLLECIGSSIQ